MDGTTQPTGHQEIHEVSIAALLPANSPRLASDEGHVRVLAGVDGELPPIIVDRATLRVVDGMHRLEASKLRGSETIAVRYFTGDEPSAFVLSVKLNSTHGLPLTLAERKNAALRIVNYHPEWSDRAIATIVGLSDKTVGAIRREAGSSIPQLAGRIGRNNECRPLTSKEGRLRASELFTENPNASTRKVAKLAGISATTAKDVRNRLLSGQDPVPPRQRLDEADSAEPAPVRQLYPIRPVRTRDSKSAVDRLKVDPSLRFSESGRSLLRSLEMTVVNEEYWNTIADNLPGHCAEIVVELAREASEVWQRFAVAVENRIDAVAS